MKIEFKTKQNRCFKCHKILSKSRVILKCNDSFGRTFSLFSRFCNYFQEVIIRRGNVTKSEKRRKMSKEDKKSSLIKSDVASNQSKDMFAEVDAFVFIC